VVFRSFAQKIEFSVVFRTTHCRMLTLSFHFRNDAFDRPFH